MLNKSVVSGNRLVIGYLGLFIIIIGIICLLPLCVLPFYMDEVVYAKCFVVPAILSIFLGYLLYFLIRNKEKASLANNDDAKLLFFVWVIAILIGSVPFALSGEIDIISSIFEATSGFTTSGISVLVPESLPHIFLFYRSLLLFFGGIGLVLVLASAISDKYGMKLYSAEGHSDKLVPNLMRSARLILSIYMVYIVIGTILYCIFGMSLFDAINHSISSLATGGFSTHSEGIKYYDNLGIEIVTIILMLMGSTNFMIHLFLIKGKFKELGKHTEFKFATIVLIISIAIMTLSVSGSLGFFKALRQSVFSAVSLITTTCYSSECLTIFPSSLILIFIFLIFAGGELGSTGGGLKRYRVSLLFKSLWWNLKSKFADKRLIQTHYMYRAGRKIVVSNDDINENNAFIGWFLAVYFVGVLLLCFDGMAFVDALIEFAGIITGAGLTNGLITAQSSALTLLTSIFGMIFGRLEVILVIMLIVKSFSNFKRRIINEGK
ncbi:MAG: TrkH family potassium uptake protein [Christensenellales bacterium]